MVTRSSPASPITTRKSLRHQTSDIRSGSRSSPSAVADAAASLERRTGRPAGAGAPAQGRVRRLLDQRGHAAGARDGRAAAADRRAAGGGADRAARRRRRPRRRRGPRLPQPLHGRRLAQPRGGGEAVAAGDAYGVGRRRRAHERGVRERQPDRADHGGGGPPRRLRRRALPDPRVRRQRGRARVLRERPRLADRALRRVDPRPGEGGGAAGGRLPGRLREGRGRSDRGRRRDGGRRARPARGGDHARGGARHPRALPGAHGPLLQRAREPRLGCRPGRARPAGGARARLPARRRGVAAHHDLRRRQGPRADALHRRVHLPRRGHRLPRRQARARLRPRDRHLGRRPPRPRGPHAGRLGDPGRRPRAARAR